MLHKKTHRIISLILSIFLLSAISSPTAYANLAIGFEECWEEGYSTNGWEDHYEDVFASDDFYDYGYWLAYAGHNCTNYAAYMAIRNGAETRVAGNATDWAENAREEGYRVDGIPAVGAIAHWYGGQKGYGPSGHVAYVERVFDDYIEISEDSYSSKIFKWRRIYVDSSAWPDNFLHLYPEDFVPGKNNDRYNDRYQDPSLPYTRLYGKNRIETAVAVSESGWKAAENVVLASGVSFPDALAGGPLAAMLDAPLLLTMNKKDGLEIDVLAQIDRLGAENIYILGGKGVISTEIEGQLESIGYKVHRLYGDNRFETAAKIAGMMDDLRGTYPETVFIADGIAGFPDALSAAAVAAAKQSPIIFTPSDKPGLHVVSENYLTISGAQEVILLGGDKVVPSSVADRLFELEIPSTRLYGVNRYETSAAINEYYSYLFSGYNVLLVTGENFPDALSGGALAAKLNAPLLLINGTGWTSQPIKHTLSSMPSQKDIYVLGGTAVVTDKSVFAHLGID